MSRSEKSANPFGYRKPDLRDPPLGHGFADFGTLDTLAGWLDRWQRRGIKLFLSEYTIPTDHANHEFNFWLDDKTQAEWLTAALRITRRWDRIYTLGYLELYDQAMRPDNDQVEWGLVRRDGSRKPAFEAFKRG